MFEWFVSKGEKILLGVLFEQRGPVLGIAFGVMFGGLIVTRFARQVSYFLPVNGEMKTDYLEFRAGIGAIDLQVR